jgi:ureidoglycolate lyase
MTPQQGGNHPMTHTKEMTHINLKAAALTAEAFAPFGDVIEITGRASRSINDATCDRFDDLAQVDVLAAAGRPLISIFKSVARTLPLQVQTLERHPLSSQAFMPLDGLPFLVVVAADGDAPLASRIRAFRASGTQGVNYRRNTWHHALIALDRTCHFLVVDRGGPGHNCDEVSVGDAVVVVEA